MVATLKQQPPTESAQRMTPVLHLKITLNKITFTDALNFTPTQPSLMVKVQI